MTTNELPTPGAVVEIGPLHGLVHACGRHAIRFGQYQLHWLDDAPPIAILSEGVRIGDTITVDGITYTWGAHPWRVEAWLYEDGEGASGTAMHGRRRDPPGVGRQCGMNLDTTVVRAIVNHLNTCNGTGREELGLRVVAKLAEEAGEAITAWNTRRVHDTADELADVIITAAVACASLRPDQPLPPLLTHNQHVAAGAAIAELPANVGLVAAAWIGYTGQNPRKGQTHSLDQVVQALGWVIRTAGSGLILIDPTGHALANKLAYSARRFGITVEPTS